MFFDLLLLHVLLLFNRIDYKSVQFQEGKNQKLILQKLKNKQHYIWEFSLRAHILSIDLQV